MKNLPGDMTHLDEKLFTMAITTGPDPRICPVAALDSQLELLASKGEEVPIGMPNYLFRTARNFGTQILATPASEETMRGVAKWAANVVGRTMTFKDMARRSAMSCLVNSGELSIAECARYFHVAPGRLSVYHRSGADAHVKAAEILAGVPKDEDVEPERSQSTTPLDYGAGLEVSPGSAPNLVPSDVPSPTRGIEPLLSQVKAANRRRCDYFHFSLINTAIFHSLYGKQPMAAHPGPIPRELLDSDDSDYAPPPSRTATPKKYP